MRKEQQTQVKVGFSQEKKEMFQIFNKVFLTTQLTLNEKNFFNISWLWLFLDWVFMPKFNSPQARKYFCLLFWGEVNLYLDIFLGGKKKGWLDKKKILNNVQRNKLIFYSFLRVIIIIMGYVNYTSFSLNFLLALIWHNYTQVLSLFCL